MKIDLNNFEEEIDSVILQRGLSYFKEGRVEIISQSPHEVKSQIEGSEKQYYTTTLSLEGDILKYSNCSCPYNRAAICKHMVAVIYHIKQEKLGIKVKGKKTLQANTKTKQSSTEKQSEQLEKLLKNTSKVQLVEFIKNLCKTDKSFRENFITQIKLKDNKHSKHSKHSKEGYKATLSACMRSISKKRFIDYHHADFFGDALYEVCEAAEKRLQVKDYTSAINAATTVMEQGSESLQFMDDSNGSLGNPIQEALAILQSITKLKIDEKSRLYLFNYAITAYKEKTFKGTNWHEEMLLLALDLMLSEDEINELRELIQKQIRSLKNAWMLDPYKEMMAKLISKSKGESAGIEYMGKHLNVINFRKQFIEKAIATNDLQVAQKLITKALVGSKGDEITWLEYKLKVETLSNNVEEITITARKLFLKNHIGSKPYYDILKQNVALEKWDSFIQTLYIELEKSRYNWEQMEKLTLWEKDWLSYINWLKKHKYYSTLQRAEKELPKNYHPQIITLYKECILQALQNNMGRKHYQEATQALRRMKKLGAISIVEEFIEELRTLYAKRPALLNELNAV